jgi:hypothetical protein
MSREFADLPVTQRRRSSIVESRVIDAVLDVIPTAEPKMDDIAAKIRPILQVCFRMPVLCRQSGAQLHMRCDNAPAEPCAPNDICMA